MSWYRTGTVAVTNGSKNVTGVGTLWASSVNVGDAFALVDANGNPTGAWYEVETVTSNTALVLKQSYAGTTGSNKTYCVFNLVGNMTTPSFAQRLARFFDSFQGLIDKPTTTPTASSIPIADSGGKIDSGWIKDASTTVKGVVELATTSETTAGQDATRAVTPAGFLAGLRGNILGTVSQSGGKPTGAVIERGSNSNGEYVKFADGTMICSIVKTVTDQAIDQSYGSIYTGTRSWTYPAVFAESPVTSTSSGRWGTGSSWGITRVISATSATFVFFDVNSRSTGTDFYYSASAIGRWF